MLVTQEQQVVLRTIEGNQLMQWLAEDIQQLTWGRELRQVSKSTLQVGSVLDRHGNAPPIEPWLHWIDVYSTDLVPRLYWSGPLVTIDMDEYGTSVSAIDVAGFLARTRVPITKAWDAVDPSVPALELWNRMLEIQGLQHIVPVQRLDPNANRFDCSVTFDEKTLDKAMQDLEQQGLRWSVVGGVPVLGSMPEEPIASLDRSDFLNKGPTLTRDGTNTYNDVLLRGADSIARARTDHHGLNLQTIVNVNDMFGLTNVNAAAQDYVRSIGKTNSSIRVPSGSVLDPSVDLDINQLVPSARFAMTAFGLRLSTELESVSVTVQSGQSQTAITLTEVADRTEIGDMLEMNGNSSFQSGVRKSPDQGQP